MTGQLQTMNSEIDYCISRYILHWGGERCLWYAWAKHITLYTCICMLNWNIAGKTSLLLRVFACLCIKSNIYIVMFKFSMTCTLWYNVIHTCNTRNTAVSACMVCKLSSLARLLSMRMSGPVKTTIMCTYSTDCHMITHQSAYVQVQEISCYVELLSWHQMLSGLLLPTSEHPRCCWLIAKNLEQLLHMYAAR